MDNKKEQSNEILAAFYKSAASTTNKKAIALSYQPSDPAPKIVASGQGKIAEKIIETAKESNVPVHKDAKLTESLSRFDIGEYIPPDLYEVVAQVLVFVDDMDSMQRMGHDAVRLITDVFQREIRRRIGKSFQFSRLEIDFCLLQIRVSDCQLFARMIRA